METKYYGIWVYTCRDGGYFLQGYNGTEKWFDHYPTEKDMETFIKEYTKK